MKNKTEFEVCNGCLTEVKHVGEDGISVCENCGVVEGQTLCLTDEELSKLEADIDPTPFCSVCAGTCDCGPRADND